MHRKRSKSFVFIFLFILLNSCGRSTDVEKAEGTITVQIPVQESASAYRLEKVNLKGVQNLKEVSGEFARFFFSPGSTDNQLTGSSPLAHFAKSGSVFFPLDFVSTQMATIYFHMQNLAALDQTVGAEGINHWPRAIGLETQITEGTGIKNNNAFYDGVTDAMMFVPFTQTDLPISVNAGIIAHEHFHSLFYKIVIKKALANNKIAFSVVSTHPDPALIEAEPKKMQRPPKMLSEKNKTSLYNEVYLRGLNEGLADFWGWLYTEDPDFMKWSLPSFIQSRTLSLEHTLGGEYLTQDDIQNEIDDMVLKTDVPRAQLVNYYKIGTPHARFLKEWVKFYADDAGVTIAESKIIIAKKIVTYLHSLEKTISALNENELLNASNLFRYIADDQVQNLKFSKKSCEFLIQYLNFQKVNTNELSQCVEKENRIILQTKMIQPQL